jgi:hypothetical protein
MGNLCRKNAFISTARGVVSVFLALLLFLPTSLPLFAAGIDNAAVSTNLLLPQGNYSYATLRGIRFNPNDPLKLVFLIDSGDGKKVDKEVVSKLVRYFLAGLTMPLDKLWVNLSPYEKNRIVDDRVALTELGTDMLKQDYILKQLAASLTYPKTEVGRKYWDEASKVNALAIPGLAKVWIVPGAADVYQKDNGVVITNSSLKVMLESDYIAYQQTGTQVSKDSSLIPGTTQAMRRVILPAINDEVNHGRNFSPLRQIYSSLILALWFKEKFKKSFYQNYIDAKQIKGIDLSDNDAKEKIYADYVKAFSRGAYNFTQRERGGISGFKVRRYFAGGVTMRKLTLNICEAPHASIENIAGNEPQTMIAEIEANSEDKDTFAFEDGQAGVLKKPGSPILTVADEKERFFAARKKALDSVASFGGGVGLENFHGMQGYVLYDDLGEDSLEYHFNSDYGWIVIVNSRFKDVKSSGKNSKFATMEDEALFHAARSIFWSQLTMTIIDESVPAFAPHEVNRLAWMEAVIYNGYRLTPYQRWAINNLTNEEKRDIVAETPKEREADYYTILWDKLRTIIADADARIKTAPNESGMSLGAMRLVPKMVLC